MRERAVLGLSLGLSLTYILSVNAHFPGRFAVKAGSIVALAVLALLRGHRGVGAGLLLSSVGDALLDIDAKLFTAGLFAFLCAHVAYTATFLKNRIRGPIERWRWIAIAAVAAFSCAFAAWLIPGLGGLAIPVALYMGAITAMVTSSIGARLPGLWLIIGAVLFLISDAILAANRFKTPIPARDYLVWGTYYFGQMFIALGYATRSLAVPGTERSRRSQAEPDSRSRAVSRGRR